MEKIRHLQRMIHLLLKQASKTDGLSLEKLLSSSMGFSGRPLPTF